MILRAEQMFDKVYLDREHPSEFIDYVAESVERELVNKFMDKLGDHKLYIVKLNEPEFIEDLPESPWQPKCAYRQNLECVEVIQCENCMMNFPWCQKFRDELGGRGFCPYGAKIIVEGKKEIEDGE
jgi:hypothetical protein